MKMNPMKENLTYRELIEVIDRNPYIRTRLDIIAYLIGRTGGVDKLDFERILDLYREGYIAE
nr:MAG TPA: hypothetical protein [Caudoviricetes sp.]